VLVGLVCIFFIVTKENQIKTAHVNVMHFHEKSREPSLTVLLPPKEYTPKHVDDLQYRTVELVGTFLPTQAIYLANRAAANNSKPSSKKPLGFHILSPFLLENGKAVWINRGWIARDPSNRKKIPVVAHPEGLQTITGYVAPSTTDLFEIGRTVDHKIDGHVIALHFHPPAVGQEIVNGDTYPFVITQTSTGADQLVRPAAGYIQEVNYSFELRTWWFILLITVGFWFLSGLVFIKRQGNSGPTSPSEQGH
jgi:hypothetical protein